MSPVRIIALLGLALMLAGMAAIRAADSHTQAWLTGQCFRDPAPVACYRASPGFSPRHYDI
ncbi:MAG TPA: hypothetical protein VH019_01125 [Rhizomicrobium sp.]|jgi:hypothetical protein|nr:hypothetical protein [Rhizomicrobium sp.]